MRREGREAGVSIEYRKEIRPAHARRRLGELEKAIPYQFIFFVILDYCPW